MGITKNILHNDYTPDDEKLPGRTVSIKTQEGGGPAVEYPIAVNKGGTGASTAAAARHNLGLGTVATENTVPVSKGGTGAGDAAGARENIMAYTTGGLASADTAAITITTGRWDRYGDVVILLCIFKVNTTVTGPTAMIATGAPAPRNSNQEFLGAAVSEGSGTKRFNINNAGNLFSWWGGDLTAGTTYEARVVYIAQ